jgi:hypothetical protein
MKKIIIIIITLFVIGLLLYLTLFANKNKNLETFTVSTCNNDTSCSIDSTSLVGLMSNPMVDRNGTNVIVSPTTQSNMNVAIKSPGCGCWSGSTDDNLKGMSLIVNLNKLTKVHYVITQGIKFFKLYYSTTDNDPSSYDEILYRDRDSVADESSSIYFITNSHENITQFGNLSNIDGQPIFAKYIKLVPVTSSAAGIDTTSSPQQSNDTIGANGVKIEVMGMSNDAKQAIEGDSLIGISKFYDIEGNLINNKWIADKENKDLKLRIVFEEDGVIVPKTIYSIIFKSGSNSTTTKQWVKEFSITYSHKQSKLSDTIYYVKGNTNCGDNIFQYYLETPVVATELVIKPTKLNKPHGNGTEASMEIIDIMGSQINKIQEQVSLEKTKKQYCSSNEDDINSGSVSDLLGKQAEIQQLCDAIDLQDQIKENNMRIQKNRQYIMQLEDHDKKIANLEEIVNKMKHLKYLRQKATDTGMMEQKDKQSEIDRKLKELVDERKKSQSQFNVKLNIQPGMIAGLERMAGSDTARTPVEGFADYTDYIQPITNKGYNYIPYQQNFYEEVALKSANCDTNAKFIKRMM